MLPKLTTVEKHLDQYIAMINQYLDILPIATPDDFEIAIANLNKLLESNHTELTTWISQYDNVETNNNNNHQPTKNELFFQHGIKDLAELLISPDMYVPPEEFQIFKALVTTRIIQKRDEFNKYTAEDKLNYIAALQKKTTDAKEGQQKLQQHAAPAQNSQNHVLSEQQWLDYEYNRQQAQDHKTIELFSHMFHPNQLHAIIQRYGRWRYVLNDYPHCVQIHLQCGGTLGFLFTLDADQLEQHFIYLLIKQSFNGVLNKDGIKEFLALDKTVRTILLDNALATRLFLQNGATIADFSKMQPQLLLAFCENYATITAYMNPQLSMASNLFILNNNTINNNRYQFTFHKLIELADYLGKDDIIVNGHKIVWLAQHTNNFESLIYDDQFRNFYFENYARYLHFYKSKDIKSNNDLLDKLINSTLELPLDKIKSIFEIHQSLLDIRRSINGLLGETMHDSNAYLLLKDFNDSLTIANALDADRPSEWYQARLSELKELLVTCLFKTNETPVKLTKYKASSPTMFNDRQDDNILLYENGEYVAKSEYSNIIFHANGKMIDREGRGVFTRKAYKQGEAKRMKYHHEVRSNDENEFNTMIENIKIKFSELQNIFEAADKVLVKNNVLKSSLI